MRYTEFQLDERKKLKEKYPHLTEQQLDEILPAIGAAAGAAGKVAAKGAMAAGRVGAKMGTAAAKGAGNIAKAGAKGAGNLAKKAGQTMAKGVMKKAQQVGQKVGNMAAQQLLKPGTDMEVGGQMVKVDAVKGNEVTLADPKNPKAPKTVIQKKDPIIKQALDAMIS
tara:strand:+ start:3130 stop:3630 length:501 start_codon:yes stop_codon:yes gene_type:complete